MTDLPVDLPGLARGGKAALARVLSALESAPDRPELATLMDAASAAPRGMVIGITGPPGVGKSTLLGAFIARLRARGETVAVIAVDPSSRRSGGALLGDRIRIASDPQDAGLFVRSTAARRRLGGLSDIAFPAALLMRALYDRVFVETVGVGQSETEIADCADLVVFCAQPGSGDSLQYMKAGIIEEPDVMLVTKGDIGAMASRTAGDLRAALTLAAGSGAAPPIEVVSSQSGAGIDAALDRIGEVFAARTVSGGLAGLRRRQARVWAERRIAESLGQAAADTLGSRLSGREASFAEVSRLCERARALVHESLKNI
ncbi:MAG TPA: ATP/GTP-binding protein [Amaricoccus sp.]|uniref:ArgK/MeaB family GTPase n=1 Tax=Amaricoccus sp. TaxID=1872485 RepID=UPI002C28351D|nr:methylmalonyl Co-A mutase-associated GTPase MeaB [Amaricoccus sp.]HMQ93497.1 ATP/GTP-binding protein [Amaricoccus sp.]HMR52180.1 ATP/GTP-binding protein [Amaricoccus sp.]HMR59509.1 ATP/GTP-binding protein [Amaricoccus sp.]HMT99032.1 ATP/GTP-binding protein [Amaricoccus sp.]